MKKIFLLLCCVIPVFFLGVCDLSAKNPKVKNVIYIIGDGMGMGQLTMLAEDAKFEETFLDTPGLVTGISKTYSMDSRVTDSAAGGTALATGHKTNNGIDAISASGDTLVNIMTLAKQSGRTTGIVDSGEMFDATPACFYGHVNDRDDWPLLAEQLSKQDVDILFGSEMEYVNAREDGRDLTPVFERNGYIVTDSFDEFMDIDGFHRVLALVDTDSLMAASDGRDCLTLATKKTFSMLDSQNNPKGFFLMIEGARIDHFGHENDSDGFREEMRKFNYMVEEAIDYADSHKGTLVVITADHETGGCAVYYDDECLFCTEGGEKTPEPAGHTGNVVPVLAYGCGASCFNGFMENTDIPKRIAGLMRIALP